MGGGGSVTGKSGGGKNQMPPESICGSLAFFP